MYVTPVDLGRPSALFEDVKIFLSIDPKPQNPQSGFKERERSRKQDFPSSELSNQPIRVLREILTQCPRISRKCRAKIPDSSVRV